MIGRTVVGAFSPDAGRGDRVGSHRARTAVAPARPPTNLVKEAGA